MRKCSAVSVVPENAKSSAPVARVSKSKASLPKPDASDGVVAVGLRLVTGVWVDPLKCVECCRGHPKGGYAEGGITDRGRATDTGAGERATDATRALDRSILEAVC